ncbi:DUF3828 domain-containing protein [Paraburkholderia susongensis]|uniref:DUF3828 domain-containing protein n=1 Tax=Paraburkholderia susongensis TaxID=1515439 RepID=A0A1X7K141_9BURK|nr:DUF3828 domain-containing protein [Paraburkholderia susongensis]SMG33926.1 Protein of unknown function [Paraburkholderia susongensis]
MKKYLAFFAVMLLLIFNGFSYAGNATHAKQTTPEASVRDFYTWFIPRLAADHDYPVMDKEIYIHVAKKTVDFLRKQYKANKLAEDAEYFTKVQDFDEKDWEAHIAVHPVIMLENVALVPVTFGSKDKQTNIVFLRQEDGVWKITKVVDTFDYPE